MSIDWTKPDAAMRRALELQAPRPRRDMPKLEAPQPAPRMRRVPFEPGLRVMTPDGPGQVVNVEYRTDGSESRRGSLCGATFSTR